MLLWLLSSSYCARRFRLEGGVQLHDEGPLKIAAAIAGRSTSPLDGLFRRLSLPDLVVALRVDPAVAVRRVRQRGDDRTPSEIIERWAVIQPKGATLVAQWAPTFFADTTSDEDYGGEIAELIAGHFSAVDGAHFIQEQVTARLRPGCATMTSGIFHGALHKPK